MKMVIAIIKPFKLDDVRNALLDLGISGMTVTEVRGYGRQKGQAEIYRGDDQIATFLPKIKLEIAVEGNRVDDVVKAIGDAANTGRIGDGKIFVYAIEKVVRIRTGEEGEDAL